MLFRVGKSILLRVCRDYRSVTALACLLSRLLVVYYDSITIAQMLLLHRQLSIFIIAAVSCAQSSYGFLSRISVLRSLCSGIRSYVLVYLSLFYYLVLIWASGTQKGGLSTDVL